MTDVVCADCRALEFYLEPGSVDAVVTDPPYGLKFMGKRWDYDVPDVETWRTILTALKPGGHMLAFGGARTYHRMVVNIEDAGFEIRDCIMWLYGQGFPKSHNLQDEWEGWGTALKPAHEPIVLCRKPLIGTVEKNVRQYGVGALNIDGCRVDVDAPRPLIVRASPKSKAEDSQNVFDGGLNESRAAAGTTTTGRWPGNVLHDGSEEVLSEFPDAPGQLADVSYDAPSEKTKNVYALRSRGKEPSAERRYADKGVTNFAALPGARRLDSGSAARFFYCAKASRSERNAGCDDLPDRESGKPIKNNHPTVKPITLMRYLCRLITPPGGLIYDPFTGSGSTGCAAVLEGFRFIGAEREADSAEIARRRIAYYARTA